ncbi:GlxA family transcriptional regulator [Acidisoma sp. C75]
MPAPSRPNLPRRFDVLVQNPFSLMCLAAIIEPLRVANRVASRRLYQWRLITRDGAAALSTSGLTFGVDAALDAGEPREALILIGSYAPRVRDAALRADLRRAARDGAIMGGIEAGTWGLARAGLLHGFAATTHWEDLAEFAETFPKVDVRQDRFVMDRKRWTAGGAAPALDMMLTMLAEEHGLPLALNVASVFVYDQTQPGSAPQPAASLGRLLQDDPALARAITLMQRHVEEPISIEAVAARAGVLRRTLELRFQARLGQSPHHFYLDLRLAAAKRMLEQSVMTVAEIATVHGFASASSFARAFRRRFQMSPLDARAAMRKPIPAATGTMEA